MKFPIESVSNYGRVHIQGHKEERLKHDEALRFRASFQRQQNLRRIYNTTARFISIESRGRKR